MEKPRYTSPLSDLLLSIKVNVVACYLLGGHEEVIWMNFIEQWLVSWIRNSFIYGESPGLGVKGLLF